MSLVKKNTSEMSKWYLPGILGGLLITLRHLLTNLFHRNKMITLNYPEEKYEYSLRFKGNHVLTVNGDGSLRCTACMLCATNCPAACPVDAIRMGPEWQTPGCNGNNFIYGIEQLAYRPQLKGGILSIVDDEERYKSGI